eukprot:9504127-Pyramimonas_sp.AAC.1
MPAEGGGPRRRRRGAPQDPRGRAPGEETSPCGSRVYYIQKAVGHAAAAEERRKTREDEPHVRRLVNAGVKAGKPSRRKVRDDEPVWMSGPKPEEERVTDGEAAGGGAQEGAGGAEAGGGAAGGAGGHRGQEGGQGEGGGAGRARAGGAGPRAQAGAQSPPGRGGGASLSTNQPAANVPIIARSKDVKVAGSWQSFAKSCTLLYYCTP